MDKINKLRELIKDNRINIARHYFEPRKINDPKNGTLKQIEGYWVENCIMLTIKHSGFRVTNYVTMPFHLFDFEFILSSINMEIRKFNNDNNANLKELINER